MSVSPESELNEANSDHWMKETTNKWRAIFTYTPPHEHFNAPLIAPSLRYRHFPLHNFPRKKNRPSSMKALSLNLAPSRDNFPPDSRAARVSFMMYRSFFLICRWVANSKFKSHFPLFSAFLFSFYTKIVLPQCTYHSVDKSARYLNRTNKSQTLHVCTDADGRRDIPAVSCVSVFRD